MRGDEMIVIVPVKRDANGNRVLGLPKGHPDGDETPEQAATREVSEETGVDRRAGRGARRDPLQLRAQG